MTMVRPPSLLREMTAAACAQSRAFATAFEYLLWSTEQRNKWNQSQTNLYAICVEDGWAWKFGLAVDPEKRLGQLQIGNPRRLVLYAHTPAMQWMETFIHRALRRHRLHGEWFEASPRTLTAAHLVEVAHEQIHDMRRHFDDYQPVADDTVAALCSRFDEALAELRKEKAAA